MPEAAGIVLVSLLCIFSLRRSPLFSVQNIVVVLVVAHVFAGIALLPISLMMEKFPIHDGHLYGEMLNRAVRLALLGAILFLGTIVALDKVWDRPLLSGKRWEPRQLKTMLPHLGLIHKRSLAILGVFTVLGGAVILATFWHTRNVPFFNPDVAGKYFKGFTERYVTLRPFYVTAQQLLAITSFFWLYFCTRAFAKKSFGHAGGYLVMFILCLVPLVMTLKRGETLYSSAMYLGALALMGRVKTVRFLLVTLLLIFVAYVMDPANYAQRGGGPPTPLPERVAATALKPSSRPPSKTGFTYFFANSFCVQIREDTRLFYGFHHGREPYLWGKTFLASAVGFVPAAVSPFRQKYSIGRVTLRLFGADPEISGGPRIDLIGEAYINFGITGVLVFPVLAAFVTWQINRLFLRVYHRYQGDNKFVLMSLIYLGFTHFSLGLYLGGSSPWREGVLRIGTFLVIALSSVPRSVMLHSLSVPGYSGKTLS